MTQRFETATAGTKVRMRDGTVQTVERVTPTLLIIGGKKFRRDDGWAVGTSGRSFRGLGRWEKVPEVSEIWNEAARRAAVCRALLRWKHVEALVNKATPEQLEVLAVLVEVPPL